MEAVGWAAVVAAATVMIAGVVLAVRSIPDARRYMRMRRM